MNEQEATDLKQLLADLDRERRGALSYLAMLDTADARVLEQCGYRGKTNAEAMQDAFHRYQRMVKKLTDAHVSKYPDTKKVTRE